MSLPEFLLFLTAVILSSSGQALLKLGATKLGRVNTGNFMNLIMNILFTPELIIGLLIYGLSAVLFILVLTRVNLSVAGPALSISYVFSVLMGYFFFKETLTVQHLIGLAFVMCGVILVVRK